MQYEPRQSPSPIQPTGFFTGIQFRPIIGGVVVDTIATYALTWLYYSFFVAKDLAGQAGAEDDAFTQYFSSTDGLIVSLLLGSLGTVIGGFFAAYKAGTLEMKHGALVGMGSIVLGLVLQVLLGSDDSAIPEWFMALSFAAAIPAGAIGGFFAEMVKNAMGGGRPVGGGGWPPSR